MNLKKLLRNRYIQSYTVYDTLMTSESEYVAYLSRLSRLFIQVKTELKTLQSEVSPSQAEILSCRGFSSKSQAFSPKYTVLISEKLIYRSDVF